MGISTLEFAEMQKIVQNKTKIEFGTKIPYLVFWTVTLEKCCHI